MELELDRTQLSGYETVLDTTVCQEETMEMIVPDACPDILRICDTEGTACLKSKESQEGRVELTGTARAAVLYLPDGTEGMRRLEVAIPFSCSAEGAQVTSGCTVIACPWIQAAETRLLNPRKVLVRIQIAVSVQVYAPVSEELCAGVSEPESAGVEQLVEPCQLYQVSAVQEKPFTFADDVMISGGKPEAEELLKSRVSLRCNESKVIGSKLIFKGEAMLQLLYRAAEGALCTTDYVLPFSQIMEVNGVGEDCDCEVQVVLTDTECRLDGSDGRTISVALGLLAQATVWETRSLELLTDLYSTAYQLEADTRPCSLKQLADRGIKNQTVREIIETGMQAKSVSDTYVRMGPVTQRREGERLELSVEANVTILYQAEDDTLSAVSRTLRVPCTLDVGEGAECACRCGVPGEIFAVPSSSGIEVRFQVDIQYLAYTRRQMISVSGVHLDENGVRDTAGKPSIVLRMVAGGERLWDIAKAYGTTAQDILQANDLSEDALPAGQLLLIPRKR